jgi:hypothetical protein
VGTTRSFDRFPEQGEIEQEADPALPVKVG